MYAVFVAIFYSVSHELARNVKKTCKDKDKEEISFRGNKMKKCKIKITEWN